MAVSALNRDDIVDFQQSCLGRLVAFEPDLNDPYSTVLEFVDRRHLNQLALADNPYPLGDPFDLGQDVR